MRWRRAIVAVLVGVVVGVFVDRVVGIQILFAVQEVTAWMMPWATAAGWAMATEIVTAGLLMMPGVVVALLVYATGKPPGDDHTRCGNCGYILKGLTEPRCPECGERI